MGALDGLGERAAEMQEPDGLQQQETLKLAAALGLIAIVAAGAFFLFFQEPATGKLVVAVKNAGGQGLWRAEVTLAFDGKELSGTTDRSGSASFSDVPIGKNISVKAIGRGFRDAMQEIRFASDGQQVQLAMEAEPENAEQERTITFASPNGVVLEGKLLTVELSCSEGMALDDPVQQVSGGRMDTTIPSGCGRLMARVTGSGFLPKTYDVSGNALVKLETADLGTGYAKITVTNSAGNYLDGIRVTINDPRGVPVGGERLTSFGEADFQAPPGNYTARITDDSTAYAPEEQQFTLQANQEAVIRIALAEKPLGVIKARIVDASTGRAIANATAVLALPDGSQRTAAATDGNAQFAVSKQGNYKLTAIADTYSESQPVQIASGQISGTPYTISLRKCDSQTCGIVKIRVIDEDGLPVANARTALLGPGTGFYLERHGLRYTDMNGTARFFGVPPGTYSALAQKYPAEGTSADFEVAQGTGGNATISMTIGSGTIEVQATDASGDAVPFAFAHFRSDSGTALGSIPLDSGGKGTLTTKADKQVFATVSANGYSAFTSQGIQVYPDQKTVVKATLAKPMLGSSPGIEFLGLTNQDGSGATAPAAGKSYIAQFRLSVPETLAGRAEQLGAFIRVGTQALLEKDDVSIATVNAPRASVMRGTSYNEPRGMDTDIANLTNENAKWALITWEKPEIRAGIYSFGVEVRVANSATGGSEMPVFYRAFTNAGDGTVQRDPQDAELGAGRETPTKQWLYAKSYEKSFQEGAEQQCDERFCYSERLLDKTENLYVNPPYQPRIFRKYELQFEVTNNSGSVHDNASIKIENSKEGATLQNNMKIHSYAITNADSREFSSTQETYAIAPVSLGNFRQNKAVSGKLTLEPQALGQASLHMQIASDRAIVLDRFTQAQVVSEGDLNVAVLPETLPALAEFDLNVSVKFAKGQEDFEEVQGALVRVERTTPDRAKSFFTKATNGNGVATITIPPSPPGTLVKVHVEKDGFAGKEFTARVSSDIVEFRPASLASKLDLTTNTEEKLALEAKSLVPVPLNLKRMSIIGNFGGLLDNAKMNNWLRQYEGRTNLAYLSPAQFTILSSLTDDARLLDKQKKLSGTLHFEFADSTNSVKWPMEVPFSATISLAEPPKEENCIEVTLKEWKDATLGGIAQAEFSIKNNCVTQAGKPLSLRNLKAKVQWKSNKLGNVELQVTDHASGQEAGEVLNEGVYSRLFDVVPAEADYVALATFTPKGGSIGKKAEFSIILDAEQLTDSGGQDVGSSNAIDSQIDIIDLSQCIKYTPDAEAGLEITPAEKRGTIDIDSSACGSVTIDFWMCKGDKDCSGGAEGGLTISPQQFTLTQQTPKKTVAVSRQTVPGMYGLGVFVRTPGSNYRQVNTIDVIAEPTEEDAFSLSKYEFSLKGANTKDSAELTNRFFTEQIAIDASVCDWGEATKKKWWDWKGAGVGGVVGALLSIRPALEASKVAATQVANTTGTALNGAKTAASATSATTKTSTATLQGVCQKINSASASVNSAYGACVAGAKTAPLIAAAQTLVATAQSKCQALMGTSTAAETTADSVGDSYRHFNALNVPAISGVAPETRADTKNTAYFDGASNEAGQSTAYFSSNAKYIVPAAAGIAAAAIIIPKVVAHYTAKQTSIQGISANLQAAAAKLTAAQAAIPADAAVTSGFSAACTGPLGTAATSVQASATEAQSYSGGDIAKGAVQAGASQTANAAAGTAASSAGAAITPAATAGSSLLSPGNIIGMYTIGGFFVGGVLQGLMGEDPCKQRHSGNLPDYIINLLSDAEGIGSQVKGLTATYDAGSARIIGSYGMQKIGVVFTNTGNVSNPKPIYGTFTFNATQHLHANPTKISTGNSNFGPFNVPDRESVKLESKIHLKVRTQEPEEKVPELDFDTISCATGNKTGRTGPGALPKVKLNWSWKESTGGIGKDDCLEQNPSGIYCDATQFSIMLSKRLNSLREFFDRNPTLQCPANPLADDLDTISRELGAGQAAASTANCYINDWSGYIDGEPAIRTLLETNKVRISWTSEIPNQEAFMDTVHFNALLMQDAFTEDFRQDFAQQYSDKAFFDTPDWFYSIGRDGSGNPYGIAKLFRGNNMKFTNRFFDSPRLSSAGAHEVLIGLQSSNGKFNFFNADGSMNVSVKVQLYLLKEPNPNSAFYSLPLDGLVGLEGDTFNRQGYGASFDNKAPGMPVPFDSGQQPMKTYPDSGSNPATEVSTSFENGFFTLNTSPSSRGNLLSVENTGQGKAALKFSPSKATPLMLKAAAGTVSKQNLAAYYLAASSETPIDVGQSLTFWDGAGACLDPSGTLITQSFDTRADRAAVSSDPILNWQSAYAVDFGPVNYTGDVHLRTIFYTNPRQDISLSLEGKGTNARLLTPDSSGEKVPLSGVNNTPYNNPGGGTGGEITTIKDVFSLVQDGKACVVDSGRKAEFFWNPKAVYEMGGRERNISDISNSLVAGSTCIGFG